MDEQEMVDTREVVTTQAANGHTMDYRVVGRRNDGTRILSQWDATHSWVCKCHFVSDMDEML